MAITNPNVKFHRVATLPTASASLKGHLYFKSDEGALYICTGSAFEHYGKYVSGDYITVTNSATGDASISLDVNSLKDSLNSVYKTKQTEVSNPALNSGNAVSFIEAISQNANGEISVTRKQVSAATSSTAGITTVGASGGAAAYDHGHNYAGSSSDGGAATSANKVNQKLTIGTKEFDGSAAVTISAADLGLSQALVFVGTSTTDPSASGATVSGHTAWNIGDVVRYNSKEYVLTVANNVAANWVELGDESSYALNTITVTGSDGLTGGGALSSNQVIKHASAGTSVGSYGDSSAQTPEFGATFKVPTLSVDKFGHVCAISEHTVTIPSAPSGFQITETLTDDDVIVLTEPTGKGQNQIKIDAKHAYRSGATSSTENLVKGATADVSVAAGGSGTINVPKVTVDKYGHVQDLTEQTLSISIPAAANDPTVTLNYSDGGTDTFTLNQGSAKSITMADTWVEF